MFLVPTRPQYTLFRVPPQWKLQIFCNNVDHHAEFALLKCDQRVLRRSTNLCVGCRLDFVLFFPPLFWSTACIGIICSIPFSAYRHFLYPRVRMLTTRPSESDAKDEKYLHISKLMTVLLFVRDFFRELCCCFWIPDRVQCSTVGSLHSHFHSYSPYAGFEYSQFERLWYGYVDKLLASPNAVHVIRLDYFWCFPGHHCLRRRRCYCCLSFIE